MPMTLRASDHGGVLPREITGNAALAQIGWLGFTGMIYELRDEPKDWREPGGYQPLYIQVGVWEELEPGAWSVRD